MKKIMMLLAMMSFAFPALGKDIKKDIEFGVRIGRLGDTASKTDLFAKTELIRILTEKGYRVKDGCRPALKDKCVINDPNQYCIKISDVSVREIALNCFDMTTNEGMAIKFFSQTCEGCSVNDGVSKLLKDNADPFMALVQKEFSRWEISGAPYVVQFYNFSVEDALAVIEQFQNKNTVTAEETVGTTGLLRYRLMYRGTAVELAKAVEEGAKSANKSVKLMGCQGNALFFENKSQKSI